MRNHWNRKLVVSCVIVPALLLAALPISAGAAAAPSASSAVAKPQTPYALTKTLKAGVKSVSNERTQEGARIGVVVRLYNEGADVAVVPDYEVRVTSAEGVSYTLQPSAANAKAVQPKETVEFSYMIVVQRQDDFSLAKVTWLSVDEYVYPKKETVVASVPIASMEWKGNGTQFSDPKRTISWGNAFALSDAAGSSLRYTPVQLSTRDTAEGLMTLVRLQVVNEGSRKEWIPAFELVGNAGKSFYTGTRNEAGSLSVEPGERTFLHFTLPADHRGEWSGLTVVTPESFVQADGTVVPYAVGQLHIQVPTGTANDALKVQNYKLKSAIAYDASNPAANPDIELALVELLRFEQAGDGYQTAVAKFRMINRGSRVLLLPNFGVEWVASDGDRYEGVRQNTVWRSLLPDIGLVISYAFTIPASEQGEKAVLHILDSEGTGGGEPTSELLQVPIAAVSAKLSPPPADSAIELYPFAMKINRWELVTETEGASDPVYTYALELDVDIARAADAAIDKSSVRMRAELVDPSGQVLDAQTLPLSGTGRLTDGERLIRFEGASTERRLTSLAVHLYEVFDTPEGEVSRLLKTLK